MSDDPPKAALQILSLGAGVQSTAILILSALGQLPRLDAAIFADTGWEPQAVYDHLNRIEEEVAKPAGIPISRVASGNIRDDALDPTHRFASMPLYVLNKDGSPGMGRRQCTSEYKLKPIKREVRRLLGYPHPTPIPKGTFVDQWIGISTDEVGRARGSDVRYAQNVFPLLDLRMSRTDCERLLRTHGFGETPKSACIGCPFHGNRQWRKLRDETPEEWEDAVDFDARMRHGSARANANGQPLRGTMYLHRSRVPLGQAPIDRVTAHEWRGRQTDLVELLADDDAEVGAEDGCSPFTCRSDGA